MPAGYPVDWHDEWIEENLNRFSSYSTMAEEYNRVFGTDITPVAIKNHAKIVLGLSKVRQNYRQFTDEQREFLKENYSKYNNRELLRIFNEKFHETRTMRSIKSFGSAYGIKVDKNIRSTYRLKNLHGESSKRAIRETGAVRIECGRPVMKDANGNWSSMAKVIWEKEHGPVPEGYIVTTLNNDPFDCRLENIVVLSNKCHGLLFNLDLRSTDPEITKTGIMLCELIEAVKNQEKEK